MKHFITFTILYIWILISTSIYVLRECYWAAGAVTNAMLVCKMGFRESLHTYSEIKGPLGMEKAYNIMSNATTRLDLHYGIVQEIKKLKN